MPRNDNDNEPVVTIGSTQWVFSTGSLPIPSAPAVPVPPRSERSPARPRATQSSRARRTAQPRRRAGLIKRWLKGRRIDAFHRREIEMYGKCSTPRCPWPGTSTGGKCPRCANHAATDHLVVVTGKHLCVDGSERAIDAGGNCDGPCPTSLAGRRRSSARKPGP